MTATTREFFFDSKDGEDIPADETQLICKPRGNYCQCNGLRTECACIAYKTVPRCRGCKAPLQRIDVNTGRDVR